MKMRSAERPLTCLVTGSDAGAEEAMSAVSALQELACSPLRIHGPLFSPTAVSIDNGADSTIQHVAAHKQALAPATHTKIEQAATVPAESTSSSSSDSSADTWVKAPATTSEGQPTASNAAAPCAGSCSPSSTISESPPPPEMQLDRPMSDLPPLPPGRKPRGRRRQQEQPFSKGLADVQEEQSTVEAAPMSVEGERRAAVAPVVRASSLDEQDLRLGIPREGLPARKRWRAAASTSHSDSEAVGTSSATTSDAEEKHAPAPVMSSKGTTSLVSAVKSAPGGDGKAKPSRQASCPWTPAEDARLQRAVDELGPKRWSAIAKSMPGRSGKQCRLRWCNQIDPSIKHDAWQESEDQIILQAHRSPPLRKNTDRVHARSAPQPLLA